VRYCTLPTTDLTVSVLCLGSAHMGTRVSEVASFRILDAFVDKGGTFIDTARAYAVWVPGGEGASETLVGKWLHSRRHGDRVVVATKGGHPAWSSIETPRLSRDEIRQDCLASRSALKIATLPLYWLHRDDPLRPLEDIFSTMEDLRHRGYIRHYGFSNWSTERMRAAMSYAACHGLTGFVANQPMWSYAEVNPAGIPDATSYAMDADMAAFHREWNLPVVPYSAQAKGFFNKVAKAGFQGLDADLRAAYDNPLNRSRFDKLTRFARESGHNLAALALAWLVCQPDLRVIPVIWSADIAHLDEALQAGDLVLGREAVRSLA